MLAVLLALASAVSYGGSDFAAGLASRRFSIITVTFLASGMRRSAWPARSAR